MFKNYIKIAWRSMGKNKLFSMINIFGLSIGITCCILIFLYVQNELSFDKFHEKADRIVRLTSIAHQPKNTDYFAATSPIMSQKLHAAFPSIENTVRFISSKRPLSYNNKKLYETKIIFADSTLFDVFTFPMIEGEPSKALTAPYSIVITETTAKKYFGNENAFGKMMQLSDTLNVMVKGIIKDVPLNSHFTFDCVVSRSTIYDLAKNNPRWRQDNEENWFNCDSYSYLLLREGVNIKALEERANKFMDREMADIKKDMGMWFNIAFQPLADIHLKSHLEAEIKGSNNSDITYVYIFSGTAILILLIACCNFINLSTAKSINRSKEIGLRKVIGAKRGQLIMQFLGESLVFSTVASLFSMILLLIFIPLFNSFIGTQLSMNLDILWIYLAIIFCVGLLAGLYPALLMSSFAPIRSLKGNITHGAADIIFRKGLVVFQFSIAVILIISTSLILDQLNFIQNRKIGINKEQVLAIELKVKDQLKGPTILEELKRNPKVTGGTLNNFSFKSMSNITLLPEGAAQNEVTACNVFSADEDFLKTLQIKIIEGRDFSKDFPTDVSEAFIVNEAAVKEFGWKTPKEAIGKRIEWAFGKTGQVIGVTDNFNYTSLHDNVQPVLIHIFRPWFNTVTVRLKTDNLTQTMKELETTWKKTVIESPFKYSFLEDDFDSLYRSEQNLRSVLGAFTFLSIVVACLGLFGLAAFTIKQRYKEIGIRKVLGSSVSGIVQLLSKDFLKLVIISVLIAAPVAWYMMHKWLQDFAYRTNISLWIFVVAGALAIIIAFGTVCFQAIRAAVANPVKSLRTE